MQVVPCNKKGRINVTAAKRTNAMTCGLKLMVGFQPLQGNTLIRLSLNHFNCCVKERNILQY
jgi:hypothetical protein